MFDPKNIVICGNYGATNVGDEAILDGMLHLAHISFPSSSFTVLSANPEETSKLHNVTTASLLPAGFRSFFSRTFNGELRKTLKIIRQSDLFILGGGGLFTDEKWQAVIIWGIQAFWALVYKRPLWCVGQSVGPLKSGWARFVVKKIFEKAEKIVVRDLESKRVLVDIGLLENRITVLPDVVFDLEIEAQQNMPEKYVVLSLRPWRRENNDLLYKNIAQFVDYLYLEFGFKSIFVPFQAVGENDVQIMNKIIEQLSNKMAMELYEFTLDYKKIFELMSRAQMVIGMRLHSLIFSSLVVTPFIALSYSPKVVNFVKSLGLAENVIFYDEISFKALREKFKKVMEDKESIKEKLVEMNLMSKDRMKNVLGSQEF